MAIIAKFTDKLWNGTVLTQEPIEGKLTIDSSLTSFTTATFTIPFTTGIEEFVKVEIFEVGNTDTRVFSGYIYQITPQRPQFGMVDIVCRSEKAIMESRMFLANKTYNGSVSDILADMIAVYNTSYGEQRSVNVLQNNTVQIDTSIGDNYYDFIDEIASQTDSVRDIVDGEIIFGTMIGQDLSSGADIQELYFSGLYPGSNNIASIKVVGTATRANIVITTEKTGAKVVDASGYVDRLYGVAYEQIRDGDQTDKTTSIMEKKNRVQRQYSAEVQENAIVADVGDKIKLTVENTNDFFDIDTSVTVTEKTIEYIDGIKRTSYKVSDFITTPQTIEYFLRGIKKDIKLLQI